MPTLPPLRYHPPPGSLGLVAVSGGADSVALLRLLQELYHRSSDRPPIVAHFHHHLRGAESQTDAEFVAELAAGMGLTFLLGEADVAAIAAAEKANLEAVARRLRYDWLTRTAQQMGASWVAVGHTADDQAETILHRLIRGSGLAGLRGIHPNRPLAPGVELVRPLLHLSKESLITYLNSIGQVWREDGSNTDPKFTRNRIRAELLPLLKSFNPAIGSILGGIAWQADEAYQLLAERAEAILIASEIEPAGERRILRCEPFRDASPLAAMEALRLLWAKADWAADAMTAEHWERLWRICRDEHNPSDFPGGIHAKRLGDIVQIGPKSSFGQAPPAPSEAKSA